MNSSIEEIQEKRRCMRAIEALLFAAETPITAITLHKVLSSKFSFTEKKITLFLEELSVEYKEEKRGFILASTKEGFILLSDPEFAGLIHQIREGKKPDKLSPQALEVLSIVAFKGPLSAHEIDTLRGVDSAHTLATLEERELIEKKNILQGKRQKALWQITPRFLTQLGLSTIDELIPKTK